MPAEGGRVIVVMNAEPMNLPAYSDIQVTRACERCGELGFLNKWQQAKLDELNATYAWEPVVLGGKPRPPATAFCWECARETGIKTKARPITKEQLSNV